jgi:hypothetical protein
MKSIKILKILWNQRLPGACNRSPGSKLLSITTQLHCDSHLGGRAWLPDTILEEDHQMTIPSKFGSNWATGSRQDGQRAGPPDTILEEDHPMAIWSKFGSNWATHRFQTRRFLCEFPIGSYVKLSSAVGAIMVEGPNRRTHFWKITIQWLFHQNFVLIEQMVSDKKIFMGISHRVLC